MKSQLLPEGFRDGLPDQAELEFQVSAIFFDLMKANGFDLVKPPLVEFESSLFFLREDNENIDSFRVMDPLTQKIMGIRSDITMQIARIACGSLSQSTRPLRLCYNGDVLKVKNNNINLSRQFTQIGAEIIGANENFCLNEIIYLIIEILNKIGVKKFIINFSFPDLIYLIKEDFKLNNSDFKTLLSCFKNKNLKKIKNVSQELYFTSEYLLASVGEIKSNINHIKKNNFSNKIKSRINNFVSQIKKIKNEFQEYEIIIDLLEIDETNYHTGFCFKFYSENFKELFSGGGYKVKNENCAGFSGFIENIILETAIKKRSKKKILVPFNLEFKKKKMLQTKEKLSVIKTTKKLTKMQFIEEAKKHNCKFYFLNDIIHEVK